jgi:hypothetical protein
VSELERHARDVLVQVEGPRAAAWLVGQRAHRQALHRTGALDFNLRGAEKLPRWMAVALECLRGRERHWEVTVRRDPECVYVWRVRWLGWARQGSGRRTRPSGRRTS